MDYREQQHGGVGVGRPVEGVGMDEFILIEHD